MRTVLWLLTSAATGAFALPHFGIAGYGDAPPHDFPVPQEISQEPVPPSSHSYSFSANSSYGRLPTGTYANSPTMDTVITTIYTTVCPETSIHNDDTTSRETHTATKITLTHTYETTATITSIYTATTILDYSSERGEHSDDGWTTFKWGSTWLSYSEPTYESTLTTSTAIQETHRSSNSAPSYQNPSGNPSHTASYPFEYPHSSEWHSDSGSYPSSMTYPAGDSCDCPGPTWSGSFPHSSPTYPAGNSPPFSGTGSPSHTSPTYIKPCVPCEGQPGSNPKRYCGYTINENPNEFTPKTCRTVYYHFKITNTTIAPDGIERLALLVNGQMPGPKIEANWGDTIVVRVTNKMENNGTTIHFHGVRQFMTNEMDGVPSITQCPIAPGDSMVYRFTASNFGTSWYHSHFGLQAYEGVFGPIVIHGPSSLTYDDEETIVLQDWSHVTVNSLYAAAQDVMTGEPQTLDLGLINGVGRWTTDNSVSGSYFQMNVTYGRIYRLRIVNTAIQSTFKFHIDGHKFKVIATDFVPIQPYETDILNINIGQRYDLIMTADQPIDKYWMRSDNQQPCAQLHQPNAQGILSYAGATAATPTSIAKNYTEECVDEPYASLVPIVPVNASSKYDELIDKFVVVRPSGGTPNVFKWTLSGTTFRSLWGEPTLKQIVENGTAPTYSGDLAINIPCLKEWVYIIIDSPIPLPHPIHLHGHDFLILAQGKGLYNSDVVLNTVNPPRRDVAFMPWDPVNISGGYLVLAFETDNPGAWLMHCHIGWHVSMGFALQIIENIDGIARTVRNSRQIEDTCKNWHKYAAVFDVQVNDSGV